MLEELTTLGRQIRDRLLSEDLSVLDLWQDDHFFSEHPQFTRKQIFDAAGVTLVDILRLAIARLLDDGQDYLPGPRGAGVQLREYGYTYGNTPQDLYRATEDAGLDKEDADALIEGMLGYCLT